MSNEEQPKSGFNLFWIYGIIFLFIILSFLFLPERKNGDEISYDKFANELVANNLVKKVNIVNEKLIEVFLNQEGQKLLPAEKKNKTELFGSVYPDYTFKIISGEKFEEFLIQKRIPYEIVERTDYFGSFVSLMLPIAILILISLFFMRRIGASMGGGQIFNIGKSKATLFDEENKINVNFSNVAGLEEAKQEVMEVVEFLKNPKKFTKLGGKMPKGVLLVGPPGTGKTLLAKAVAGEAGVPFFSLSGSDFVEMFVGVGAARVRDLFKTAKEKAPCIIFIDEIDAIGRQRGRGNFTGGNDERENTLNQLLVEMDGFNTDSGVIIMAATNRADILDPALLRPGRFDRQISVDRPELKEREAIFKVHIAKITVSEDVDIAKLAAQTPGFVGADIANVCNEAALIASRKDKDKVSMEDFMQAIDRVLLGLEKKSRVIHPEEKETIAYHEAGHCIAGWYLKYGSPLVKVTIIPRGTALGYALYQPEERIITPYHKLIDEMCVSLAGRAAEEIVFNEISTGALDDLQKVTQKAYAMVSYFGMNEKVGNVSFYDPHSDMALTKPYSDQTAKLIDDEVRKLIDYAYNRVKALLIEKRQQLETIAKALLEKEVLLQSDVENLIGPRLFPTAFAS